MTKEEIREVIDAYANDTCLYPDKTCEFYRDKYCISDDGSCKCLMIRLDELGVVIQSEGAIFHHGYFPEIESLV